MSASFLTLDEANFIAWIWANNPKKAGGQRPYSVTKGEDDRFAVEAGERENALYTAHPDSPRPTKSSE